MKSGIDGRGGARMRRRGALQTLGLGLLWTGTARAGEVVASDAGAPYIGVRPGSSNRNPLPKPTSDAPKLVWTGFEASEIGGRVFLQTTLPVAFDVNPSHLQLSLLLRNCRIHLKNNERVLNTRFFDTPVEGVKARQRQKHVEIVIALKSKVDVTPKVEPGPDGTQFLVIDFPRTT